MRSTSRRQQPGENAIEPRLTARQSLPTRALLRSLSARCLECTQGVNPCDGSKHTELPSRAASAGEEASGEGGDDSELCRGCYRPAKHGRLPC